MMRSVVLLLASFLISACNIGPTIDGSGDVISEARELPSFTGIEIDGATDVEVSYGAAQSVVVVGDDNIVPIITTRVSNDVLHIDAEKPYSSREPIRVEVVLPLLRSVRIDGSGDVEVRGGPIEANRLENFRVEINGSGDVDVEKMEAERVEVVIDGSGDVEIAGEGNVVDLLIDGSGDIDALEYLAKEGTAKIDGAGDIRIRVTSTLRGMIFGSGSIFYRGDPSVLEETIRGSGKIVKL